MDDLGVPGASLGEALGTILRDKFRGEKSDEKKVGKVVASAGDADPGQDPPAGFFRKVRHAFAPPGDGGRADCVRFASPAEALGGWRLEGFEASRLVVSLIV